MSIFERFRSADGRQRQVTVLCVGWWLILTVIPARAYVLEGIHWPSNEPIVLNLQLGTPTSPLSDGSTSWDQVAEAAAAIWNPYLGSGVQFETQETNGTPKQNDGVNTVFFSPTIYGEQFGDDTLAITLYHFQTSTNEATEADVLFNSNVAFDSYRGPLRYDYGLGDYRYDLRRIAIHEFGHVLGLDHVAQSADAIMTPVTTDIDTVQADDIAGVQSIYGPPAPVVPVITGGLSVNGSTANSFAYYIHAANSPTSYGASELPTGLSVNTSTGLISGTPTVTGVFRATISATNSAGTGTATLVITIAAPPVITSNLNLLAVVGQPFSYRATATNQPTSFTLGYAPAGLSFNSTTGLLSGIPTGEGDNTTYLEAENIAGSDSENFTLKVIFDATEIEFHVFNTLDGTAPASALVQGADGSFYGLTGYGGTYGSGTAYRITPAGVLTEIHDFGNGEGTYPTAPLVRGSDGNFYGVAQHGSIGYTGTLFQLTPDGAVTTLHQFTDTEGTNPQTALVQGADGCLYGSISPLFPDQSTANHGMIYKITTDGTLTVVHSLSESELEPSALIPGSDGNFYGAFAYGGANSLGAVFQMKPDGTVTILHSFAFGEGAYPTGVTQGSDGNFYGTTFDVNQTANNTVFKVTPAGALTTLHVFNAPDGAHPSTLTSGSDGNLYGVADSQEGLSSTHAICYRITPGGVFSIIHTFLAAEGYQPSDLLQGADGSFYGTLTGGTFPSDGIIFKIDPNAPPLVTLEPDTLPTVTLAATTPEVTTGSGGFGMFTVTLSAAQTSDVLIHYTVKGSGINGTDYVELSGIKKIKAGKTSKPIKILPLGDLNGASKKTVKITLAPDAAYTVGTTDGLKVKILAGQ